MSTEETLIKARDLARPAYSRPITVEDMLFELELNYEGGSGPWMRRDTADAIIALIKSLTIT